MRSVILLALLLVLAPRTARADGESILVEAVPTAETRYEGRRDWRPKAAGRVLEPGAFVRCPGRCTLRLQDGSEVTLRDGATVRTLPVESLLLPGRGEHWTRTVGFSVLAGTVEVESRTRLLPVRVHLFGGTLTVEDGAAELHAFADRVGARVEAGEAWWRGARGASWDGVASEGTHVFRRDGGHRSRPALAPPRWLPGADHRPVGITTEGDVGTVALAYAVSPHADQVEVELVGPTTTRLARPADGHLALELPVGVRQARLRWRTHEGFWTPFGSELTVAVARFAAPRGTERLAADHLRLPPGTSLRRVAGPELEVSFGRHRGFLRAAEIPAADAAGKLDVRLRGAPSTLSRYRLEMRSLRAEVRLTPTAPVWPDDPLQVQIRLVDDDGVVHAADVHAHAYLNGEELAVRWEPRPGMVVATIPGRPLTGPATLRVEVVDADGYPIGEEIVELVGTAPPSASR